MKNPIPAEVEYTYADGNGNLYLLSPTRLRYRPIAVANSSSGVYSGGEARERELEALQYRAVVVLIDAAIADTSFHLDQRLKGSGLLTVSIGRSERKFILGPRSRERELIEELLRSLLG